MHRNCNNRRKGVSRHQNTLQKHAYSNRVKILPPKIENFQIKKNLTFFYSYAQITDFGHLLEPPRRSGSNEYPKSMFLSRNKKNNVYCKRHLLC